MHSCWSFSQQIAIHKGEPWAFCNQLKVHQKKYEKGWFPARFHPCAELRKNEFWPCSKVIFSIWIHITSPRFYAAKLGALIERQLSMAEGKFDFLSIKRYFVCVCEPQSICSSWLKDLGVLRYMCVRKFTKQLLCISEEICSKTSFNQCSDATGLKQ